MFYVIRGTLEEPKEDEEISREPTGWVPQQQRGATPPRGLATSGEGLSALDERASPGDGRGAEGQKTGPSK